MQSITRAFAHLCALHEPLFLLNTASSEIIGTRAMLDAERIIPAGIKWPAGASSVRWEDDRFAYVLSRFNPSGDYWSVLWSLQWSPADARPPHIVRKPCAI